jgi:hypothetical protein
MLVTAVTVSRWCTHFAAALLAPATPGLAPPRRGPLPADPEAKAAFVATQVRWLYENSSCDTLFRLILDDSPVPPRGRIAKFSHYDTTHACLLDLTRQEFSVLQSAWRAHRLPHDLFYLQEDTVSLPYPGAGLWARLLRAIGVTKGFTPQEWKDRTSSI